MSHQKRSCEADETKTICYATEIICTSVHMGTNLGHSPWTAYRLSSMIALPDDVNEWSAVNMPLVSMQVQFSCGVGMVLLKTNHRKACVFAYSFFSCLNQLSWIRTLQNPADTCTPWSLLLRELAFLHNPVREPTLSSTKMTVTVTVYETQVTPRINSQMSPC